MTINVQAGVDTSTVTIGYIPETTWGTTPAAPLKLLRVTGESLAFNITNITSNEISPDPQVRDLIQTDAEATGGFNFELSFGTFDEFMAAALRSEWSSDELVCGTERTTFSLEKQFGSKFHSFTGMGVNTFSLNFQVGAIVTGSFEFMGEASAQTDVSIGTGAPSPATTTTAFNAVNNVGTLGIGGSAYPGFISSLDLSLTNNMRGQKAIGTLGSVGLGYGEQSITGNIGAYFSDGAIYQDYLDGVATSISLPLTDVDGNSYTIIMPNVKFTSGQVVAGAKNQDLMAQMGYQALPDPVTGTSLKIVRASA